MTVAIDSGSRPATGTRGPTAPGIDAPGGRPLRDLLGHRRRVTDAAAGAQRLRTPGASTWPRTRSRSTSRGAACRRRAGRTVTPVRGHAASPTRGTEATCRFRPASRRDGARRRPARLDRRLRRRRSTRRGVHPRRSAATGARSDSRGARAARRVEPGPDRRPRRARGTASTDGYAPAPGRFYDRIFRSTQDYGEGITLKNPAAATPAAAPTRSSCRRYQPYGLYMPDGYTPGTPAPLLLNGHSLDVNHNEYQAVSPNLYNQLGDERSSIVITPLARGMDTWYIDSGLRGRARGLGGRASANYTVDDERTHDRRLLDGRLHDLPHGPADAGSLRGRGALRRARPPTSSGRRPAPRSRRATTTVAGSTNHIVDERARTCRSRSTTAASTSWCRSRGAQQQAQTFRDVGQPHLFYFYPDVRPLRADPRRRVGPHARLAGPHPSARPRPDRGALQALPVDGPAAARPALRRRLLGGRHGRAHAGRHVRGRDTSTCEQRFRPGGAVHPCVRRDQGRAAELQAAYPGPPFPAALTGHRACPRRPDPEQNGFEATLQNLSAVAFETGRMGIDPAQTITAALSGSGSSRSDPAGPVPAGPSDARRPADPGAADRRRHQGHGDADDERLERAGRESSVTAVPTGGPRAATPRSPLATSAKAAGRRLAGGTPGSP